MATNPNKDLSVVIPTYERTAWLRELLSSLHGQKIRLDVVVVDDGSKDIVAKERMIESLAPSLDYPLRLLKQANQGPASARNLGISAIATELVAFLDDDVVVGTGWAENLVTEFKAHTNTVGASGKNLSFQPLTVTERFLDHQKHLQSHQFEPDGTMAYVITANCIFKKSALTEVGGFDASYPFAASDDMDLGFRLRKKGHRFAFCESAVAFHRQRSSVWVMGRTFFLYGRGAYMCASRHADFYQGAVASAELLEATKVLRVFADFFSKILSNLRDPALRPGDRLLFPILEIMNHICYQLGRIYEKLHSTFSNEKR